jgi:hypothetical protein
MDIGIKVIYLQRQTHSPKKDRGANLELSFFGFTDEDLDKNFMLAISLD